MRYYNEGEALNRLNNKYLEVPEDMFEDNDETLFAYEDSFGVRHYYKDTWEKVEDEHFEECPVSIAAKGKRISTLCVCRMIEEAWEGI